MIFYIILFLFSIIGLFSIIFRHRHELAKQHETFLTEHPANFASFMTNISNEFYKIWNIHLRDQLLLFVEKRLRWFRIVTLRIEHLLFRATHRVRDASRRSTASTNETPQNTNANVESEKRDKITPS